MFKNSRNNTLNKQHFTSFSNKVLALENVNVMFGNYSALTSIELSIIKNDFLFITGPSGAGKTTLLKVIAGDIRPTSGSAIIPSDTGMFVGKIFQELRLIGRQSCETNIKTSYDPSIYSSKKEFNNDMAELCRIFGISDRLHLKVSDANGGLKQKTAIIRSLLTKPDILLADEPTSALDYNNAKLLFDILSLYNRKRGLTVIWASHNKELISKFSGRMAHLDRGNLIHTGHACFI